MKKYHIALTIGKYKKLTNYLIPLKTIDELAVIFKNIANNKKLVRLYKLRGL